MTQIASTTDLSEPLYGFMVSQAPRGGVRQHFVAQNFALGFYAEVG